MSFLLFPALHAVQDVIQGAEGILPHGGCIAELHQFAAAPALLPCGQAVAVRVAGTDEVHNVIGDLISQLAVSRVEE